MERNSQTRKKFYQFYGWFYDQFIGSALKKSRMWVSRYIRNQDFFPVLDLCCGTGAQIRLLGKKREGVYGVDLDFNMLQYASTQHRGYSFVCGNAQSLPFGPDSFRSVILSYAVHEKDLSFRYKMIQDVLRVLIPEGKIIFIDYEIPRNFISRIGRMATFIIERTAGKKHFQNSQEFLSHGGLRGFIYRSGLKELFSIPLDLGSSRIVIAERSL